MNNTWNFDVKGNQVKVMNSWFHGAKLYVNGDLKDIDKTIFAFGNEALMSASLGDHGILEINPRSRLFTVELNAFLVKGESKELVFSSEKEYGLKSAYS